MKCHLNGSFNYIHIHNQEEKMQLSHSGSNLQNDITPCALIISQSMLVICGIQIGDMRYFYNILQAKRKR